MFYYAVIPLILIKHGLNTIQYGGKHEEELVDWDPLKLMSRHSQFKGLLHFYGFTSVKAKYLPLLSAIEHVSEAVIQTPLTLIFLVNNYDYVSETDTFLGLPFPVSILSLIFSVVSFSVGVFRISKVYRYFQEEKEVLQLLEDAQNLHIGLKWIKDGSTPSK